MSKIKLLIDSGSDVTIEIAKELNLDVVPLVITMNDKEYTDYYGLNRNEYYRFMRDGNIPTTAQPSPATFLEYYEKYAEEYDAIIAITMSAGGSGTNNSANLGKQLFEEAHSDSACKIYVHDSWSTSLVEIMQAKLAIKLIEEGKSVEEILAALEEIKKRTTTYFLVNDIEFLMKGGRVSTLKGSVINTFNIKPIVTIEEGVGANHTIAIGFKSGLSKLASSFIKDTDEDAELYITHCDAEASAEYLVSLVMAKRPNVKITMTKMWGTMGTHAGPGGVGMFFARKA